jgi:hypothetical protein
MAWTEQQLKALRTPLTLAETKRDPNGMTYVETWRIRARLTQVFGYGGWSFFVQTQELVFETSETRQARAKYGPRKGEMIDYQAWSVGYKVIGSLVVAGAWDGFTYQDGAIGAANNQPSRADAHDLALKSAMSGALKRCAINLGDAFGLSLYNEGSVQPVIGHTTDEPPQEPVEGAPQEPDGSVDAVRSAAEIAAWLEDKDRNGELTDDDLRRAWREAGPAKLAEHVIVSGGLTLSLGDFIKSLKGAK